MESGVLVGVSTQWNGNSKSRGPEGLGSVCWGCCYKTGPHGCLKKYLLSLAPALVPQTIAPAMAVPGAWLPRAHLPTGLILEWPLASPGTGPVSWLGLFPRTTVPLVPISREMTQLSRQLTQHYAVAPSHRALFPEAELAACWLQGRDRWCIMCARQWDEGNADPGWVLARERGRRPKDFKCNSHTGPDHLPGSWIRTCGHWFPPLQRPLKGTGAEN